MSEKFIPLSVPHLCGNEWTYVKECLDTGWVSSAGKYVSDFESRFAQFVGSKGAVACSNGTSAIHIALLLSGVGPEDEVIVPTLTFIAPVNAVRYVNAYPVFMDCDEFLNLDVEKTTDFIQNQCSFRNGRLINKKSKRKVKAIIPVHVFGNTVNLEPLLSVAKKYGLKIIEDATESLGSRYTWGCLSGRMTGQVGDFGCFSFNGNKIITTGGGGMLVSENQKLLKKAAYLTTQAKDDEVRYIHHEVGYNYRLNNVQAALGVAQLEKIDRYLWTKRENYKWYREKLSGIPGVTLMREPSYALSNFWFYTLLVNKKKYGHSNLELMKYLSKRRIQTRPIWHLNHLQRPYRKCQVYKIEKASRYHRLGLNLPCSVGLTMEEMDRVADAIRNYAKS